MTAGMKTALVLIGISHAAFSQPADSAVMNKRYHVNYLTIGVFSAGALTADYFAIRHFQAKPQISDAEILALNTDGINSIDRWALHQNPANRSTYNKISDYIQPPMFILLPALLGLDKKIRKDWLDILFMYMEGHIITHTTYAYSWFGPMFQNRYRPLTYYTELPLAERKKEGNRNSLFSGHVGSTAFTSFFIVKVYCDYHPELGSAKYLLYTAALIPPVTMGYFRVRALAHFPSDDLVGLTLGAAIGIIVPELHKFQNKGITMGMFCTPDATGLSLCWKLPVHKEGNNEVAFSKNSKPGNDIH
ncbi:MAG: phosphatase PAP2 family protein [Bacteroidota bacterium]|nr:phosphatase PAP2 family protein [Bacteroidota bacterium]